MAEGKEVLRVYRRMLKLAQCYPSIKRKAIIRDIKDEFHANRNITDARKVCEAMASAHAGIKELSMYARLHPSQPNWSVEVGRDAIHSPPPSRKGVVAKVVRNGNKE